MEVDPQGITGRFSVGAVGSRSRETPSHVTPAVLPFDKAQRESEREYLADGLTEEVIAVLGQVDPKIRA
jgi:TolB-like protein